MTIPTFPLPTACGPERRIEIYREDAQSALLQAQAAFRAGQYEDAAAHAELLMTGLASLRSAIRHRDRKEAAVDAAGKSDGKPVAKQRGVRK